MSTTAEPPTLNLKTDKNEGKTGICPKCKCEIRCGMTHYNGNYPDKVQWQNSDGSAHIHFNPATKTYTCVLPKSENTQGTLDQAPPQQAPPAQTPPPAQQQQAPPAQNTIGRKDLTAEQITAILDKVDYWKQVEGLICGRLSIDANGKAIEVSPAKIGMYMKLIGGLDV